MQEYSSRLLWVLLYPFISVFVMHDYAFQLMTLPKASTLIRDLNTRFTSFFMIFFLLFFFLLSTWLL